MGIYLSERSRVVRVVDATIEKTKFGRRFEGEDSASDKNIIFNLFLTLDGEEPAVAMFTSNMMRRNMSDPPRGMKEDSFEFAKNLVGKKILISHYNSDDSHNGYKKCMIQDFDINSTLYEKLKKILDPKVVGFRVDDYPVYDVLKMLGFKTDSSNRIEIKLKNDSRKRIFLVNQNDYVISKNDEPNYYLLTPDNISIVFDKYYKNNKYEMRIIPGYEIPGRESINYNPDVSYKYRITKKGILEEYTRYHKSNGKITRRHSKYSLVIGQILPNSIAIFLDDHGGLAKGYPKNDDFLITQ